MSTSPIHSQASNFLGFVKTGVDPRTGQFTLAMSVPLPPANNLAGPSLTPTLSFSSLGSAQHRGFGLGWSLNLSELKLNPDGALLRLASGEQYAVDWEQSDLSIGGTLRFLDYKLCAMVVTRLSDEAFRVDLKSGNSELLTDQGDGTFLLSEMRSPEGRRLFVDWLPFGDGEYILDRIRDETKTLMHVEHQDGEVLFISNPDTEHASPLLRLRLSNDQLAEVYLPDIEQPFTFFYEAHAVAPGAEMLFPNECSGPLGARDVVHWATGEFGHLLPEGAPFTHLPRVASWTHSAGGASELHRLYEWIGEHNFLGYGSDQGFNWQHGRDNLYQVERDYEYQLIETQQDGDGNVLGTLTRTWDRFHLQTLEVFRRGECETRNSTASGIDPDLTWEEQPAWCQLPHKTVTTYIDHSQSDAQRSEQTEYRYDDYGNVLYTRYPSGVEERSDYYAAEGAAGCPPDALGMVRYLKNKTVYPAPLPYTTAHPAPVISIDYTYAALPSLLDDGVDHSVVVSEQATDITHNQLLETTHQQYLITRDAHHGSIAKSVSTLNGRDTTTLYGYEIVGDELISRVTIQGFENDPQTRSVTLSCQSLRTGLTTVEQSQSGVRCRYEYDRIGRVIRKIDAEGSAFEAACTSRYHIGDAVALGSRPDESMNPVMIEQTDVTGQRKRSWLDGAGRVVCVELEDLDRAPGVFRQVASSVYDALGRPVRQVTQDWLPDRDTPLTATVRTRYGDWGHPAEVESDDGLVAHTLTNPVTLRTEQWQQSPKNRGPRTVTLNNPAGSPTEQHLYDADDEWVRSKFWVRDGLDRVVEERLTINNQSDLVTRTRFDAYGRIIEVRRVDGAIVHWTYAPHSDAHHPETVTVTPAMEASA